MAERRVKFRGHPDGKKLFGLADRIAKATSPARWFDGAKAQQDGITRQPEWKANLQMLKDEMEKELAGGLFKDYVNSTRKIK